MSGEFRRIADEVRKAARDEAQRSSPPPQRFVVRRKNPLKLEALGSSVVLEEEDEHVDVADGLKARLSAGDTVLVHTDHHGDHLVSQRVSVKADDKDAYTQRMDDLEERIAALEGGG